MLINTLISLDTYIEDYIPYEDLITRYETSSIVYCFQLKKWANANYIFFYNPDIMSDVAYNEKLVFFDLEQWGASSLSHEILHAFGAVDLYLTYQLDAGTKYLLEMCSSDKYDNYTVTISKK